MVLVTGIEAILIGLGVIVLFSFCVMTAFVLFVRSLVRRARRNRALSGATLRTRARVARGPQRTVLALRVRLDETLRSGGAAVELLADASRSELPRLFRRIRDEASVLDLQLRLMESETDAAALADELPAARNRVEQVEGLVKQVRSAVASGLSGSTDDALSALGSEVEREVAALHAGIEQLQALNRRDGRAEPRPTTTSVRNEGNQR
ncbi:hypothetical protein BJ978_000434 [Agromyces terreus]|uniref:Uncharacterized protein n=1 Tax=Agromyces terreus TaxID=424795 RepID=A0A9X2K9Y6_9MICO|nr:hypothetical protein [Agromyces terreus]MCP2369758.1 hypothetical protein [Agromyces terreus]